EVYIVNLGFSLCGKRNFDPFLLIVVEYLVFFHCALKFYGTSVSISAAGITSTKKWHIALGISFIYLYKVLVRGQINAPMAHGHGPIPDEFVFSGGDQPLHGHELLFCLFFLCLFFGLGGRKLNTQNYKAYH